MNQERIRALAEQATIRVNNPLLNSNGEVVCDQWEQGVSLSLFAELIIRECAQLARDTDLEDVEGGDGEVLRAAQRQILEHFGVDK